MAPRGEHDRKGAPGSDGQDGDTLLDEAAPARATPPPATPPPASSARATPPPADPSPPASPTDPSPPPERAADAADAGPAVTVKLHRDRRRGRKPAPEPPPAFPRFQLAAEAPPDVTRRAAPPDRAVEPLADTIDAVPESLPIADPGRWDRYEILRLLGRGGMGAVYEARDRRIGRHVAVKFIHAPNPHTLARFLREARAQARLDHPNVCKVLEVGEVEGKAYIAMQLIQGASLNRATRSMGLDDKVRLMKTVAEAVESAHRLGIVHRDIKPANIMVEEVPGDGPTPALRPVLMDFGLARESDDSKGLTESGAVMGTPAYMPPEQARGDVRSVDARSDVYSLGATLYDLLAGAPPFTDESAVNILFKVLAQDPVPLRERDPTIPQALETIVGKCLNKEPRHRYATAADLALDLDRFLKREKIVARRMSLPARLYWRGRRNKPLAAAVLALVFSLVAFAGYGVRTVIVDARNEALARRRAELGQRLGQAVKELEWLVRSAYLVPLHNTGPEKALVRARMARIEADMRGFGDLGAGLDHYALGRGHLALGDWEEARRELDQAESQGVHEPELDYALGRVLGELYRRALEDARRSGDRSYFQQRKQEIDREYLAPALAHLERCRGVDTIPADYLEGLVHFYHGRYVQAAASARIAREKISWLYEAEALQGDVFMARALDGKDRGENDQADHDFAQAVSHYEAAAEIGRSDPQVYESLAEAWIRQEEMDVFRGKDPGPRLEQALSAADKALAAAPSESRGHTKKAFAYNFQAQWAEAHGAAQEEIERLRRAQIDAANRAIKAHPTDAYAQEIAGIAYARLAERAWSLGQPMQALLEQAYAHLGEAIRHNPRFPWAYNDYGAALGLDGASRRVRNEDPRALLEKAIEMTREATRLDEQYAIGYSNRSVWLTELAQWQLDHGQSPEAAAAEAIEAADRAIGINKQDAAAQANAGLALQALVTYRLDAGEDGRDLARKAIARFEAALAIDPKFVFVQRELARAHALLAAHERARGEDPRPSVEAGLRALAECRRLSPGDADCLSVEAMLRVERGEWTRQEGEPGADLEQAGKLALEAARAVPDRGDLWLSVAQICLRRADALLSGGGPKGPVGPVVEEGLDAAGRALARAPGTPRALAIEGALSLRRAQIEPARRGADLARARASLSKAFEANPLLKRRHGEAAAEVEREIGGR